MTDDVQMCPYCGVEDATGDPMWWRFHLIRFPSCNDADSRPKAQAVTDIRSLSVNELILSDARINSLIEEYVRLRVEEARLLAEIDLLRAEQRGFLADVLHHTFPWEESPGVERTA